MYNNLFNFVSSGLVQQGSLIKYVWELLYDSLSSQLTDSTGDPLLTRKKED